MRLGVLAGTALYGAEELREFRKKSVYTDWGVCEVIEAGKCVIVLRHGPDGNTPPHRINHRANITALKKSGVEDVFGVCSVGSLKKNIPPQTLLVPDDYFSPWNVPTFHDSQAEYITPELSEKLREKIISCAKKLKFNIRPNGVYAQTTGPRLETKAEVKHLATVADVVGMTLASEATLAQEAGLNYAGACTVDNFAHGISGETPDFRQVKKDSARKSGRILALIKAVADETDR